MTASSLTIRERSTSESPANLDCDRPHALSSHHSKMRDEHLERLAVVYVRQSSPQQVLENRESTARQYALVDRAKSLGWPADRVLVIDEDQGQSGRTAEGRHGFQRLLLEVNLDHVGLILGLEMSRLARSSKDWHHLLEVCAVFQTLLADQDGIYDPNDPNDRLLLGLKGTLSEAELHTLRSRLLRGKLNKARRGELYNILPTGYVFSPSGVVSLDPDEQVQAVVRIVFEKFDELGTVAGVTRYLARHTIRLGFRLRNGAEQGQLQWRKGCRPTILDMLHNPIYAGAYSYGRRRTDPRRKVPGHRGTGRVVVAEEDWHALLKDRLPAYISWAHYEVNQRRIAENRARQDALGAPRAGQSLLGGLVFSGHCGIRMAVFYRGPHAAYYCPRQNMDFSLPRCQYLSARVLDTLISDQVMAAIQPAALELSVRAADEIQKERERLAQHWHHQLERASFEAERAKRQYDAVEPENRLVVRELERRWEQALLEARRVQEESDRALSQHPTQLTADERDRIHALSSDVPKLWELTRKAPEDRQQIVRYLMQKVIATVQDDTEIVDVTIHWAGGFISQHHVDRPIRSYEKLHNFNQLRERMLQLRGLGRSSAEIAIQLNEEGFRSARASRYSGNMVRQILSRGVRRQHRRVMRSHERLGPDEWRVGDLAEQLGMPASTLRQWRMHGWVHARQLLGKRAPWIFWADADELDRLRRLRADRPTWPDNTYSVELTTPKSRPHV